MRRTITIALALAACRADLPYHTGLDEPVRVVDAFFHEGDLEAASDGPTITSLESSSAIALTGQRDRSLAGRAEDDAWSIGVRFADLGTGWWIREVGDVAAQYPGERDLSLAYEIGAGIPQGLHTLDVVAIDEDGRRGPPAELDLCVLDDPDAAALNPCDPTLPPPALVVSLTWNRDVDLDLVVEGPGGKQVKWKSPTTAPVPDDGVVPDDALDDPTVGRLNRDSNTACIADGRNAEAVIWEEAPSGTWSAYVDMFDACGETEVSWSMVVYRRRERDDGTSRLVEIERRTGNLVAVFDAFGGAKPPLYVLSVELP